LVCTTIIAMADMLFDDLTEIYEALIDWPRRLSHEEPFYRRLFERVGVRRVVDVACGTGHHAAMFHGWGLQVEGADISPRMIQQARAAFGEPAGLRWVTRGFLEPVQPEESFDAAICVGNSLALAGDKAEVERAVYNMLAAVGSGGVVVVHLLNFWRLPHGRNVWQKCRRLAFPEAEVLVIKGVHRCGDRGYVDLITVPLEPAGEMRSESQTFLGLEAADLEQMVLSAAAENVQLFGGYHDENYDRPGSVDLIMVAQKRRA
jgi:SAM-dependent methyltransferase